MLRSAIPVFLLLISYKKMKVLLSLNSWTSTIAILANNLYRLFALQLERYEHLSVQSLYDKFVLNGADVIIQEDAITVQLKKNLPLILEVMQTFSRQKYPWLY